MKTLKNLFKRRLTEAAGHTVDADEDHWRRLTGDSTRDLPTLTQQRMRKLAVWLWQTNLLANRLIELPVAYLLAEGVTLRALHTFWHDPINQLDIKLPRKVRELALYGEQCWPAFVDPNSGHVRLGYLDPSLIETVVTDPDNAEQPIGIVTVKDKRGHARRYKIIYNGPEDCFSPRTQEIRQTFDTGNCFYYRINTLSNSKRGHSDLLAQADWLDAYEQYLFGEVDRANLLRAFLWDVEMPGATQAEVDARAGKIQRPMPGSVRVHNDAERWQALTPDLKAVDSSAAARLFRNHVLGGGTIPEHWFGGGGDVNRATAGEMGEPTFKIYSMRQREWKHILEDVGTYVINRAQDPSGETLIINPTEPAPEWMPQAIFPELTSRDTTHYATALQHVTIAAGQALDRGLIPELLATQMIQAVAEHLGVEFDAQTQLDAARQESKQGGEENAHPTE